MTLAAYIVWSVDILVANIVEHMKLSKSEQVDAYSLASCTVLVPSLPLLTDLVVQSLLAYLLCRLASTEEGSHWVIIA